VVKRERIPQNKAQKVLIHFLTHFNPSLFPYLFAEETNRLSVEYSK